MTTYTSIPNSSLEPGKPIRSIDGLALRDNPIAITEGAAGAPKNQTASIQDDAITKDKLQSPIAGTGYLICRLQEIERYTPLNYYQSTQFHRFMFSESHIGATILVPGVITCYAEHKATNPYASYLRILKNETQVAEWSTTSTSYVGRTLDLSVDVGDVVVFQQRCGAEDWISYWRALRIYSNNPSMAAA